MAWFRRGRKEAEEPEAPSPAPVEAEAGDDDVIRPERRPTGDWMTMAPMAPTFGAMPQSFRVQTLPEIMPSHHNVRLSGSLGHRVSADAPSGSVDGLAVSVGPVSATAGHGDLPLREPRHEQPASDVTGREPAGERDVVSPLSSPPAVAADALPARPLATVLDAEPLPLARLPEPVVSRVAADPLPLVAPASPASPASAAPLPVARVVDTAAPSHSPAAAAPAPAAATDDAPLGGDSRVGGFGASLDDADLTGAGERSELFTAPPDELAAPILPRVRRGGAQAMPTIQPLLSAEPGAGAPDPADKSEAEAETLGPLPTTSTGDEPIGSAGAPVRETIGPSVESLPLAPPPDAGPGLTPPTPAVQREADGPPPGPSPSAPTASAEPATPPASRGDTASDVSPLVGDAGPLRSSSAMPEGSVPDRLGGDTAPSAGAPDVPLTAAIPASTVAEPLPLPVAQRRVDGATGSTTSPHPPPAFGQTSAPERASVAESEVVDGPAALETRAPLLGDTGVSPITAAASVDDDRIAGETGAAPTSSPAAELPLVAPAVGAPLLSDNTPTAPLLGASPSGTEAAPTVQLLGANTPSASSVQRLGASAPLLGGGRTSVEGGGESPLGLHVQRRLEPVGGSRPAAAPPSSIGSTAPADAGTPSLGLPLAPAPAGVAGAPPAPLSQLGEVHALAVSRVAEGHAPSPPATPATPSASAPGTGRAPEMPLHTAAAHMPTAAQIMVSAGLAERGPGGSLLFTNPPTPVDADGETVQRELVVQRHEEDDATPPSTGDGGGGNQGITVARVLSNDAAGPARQGGQGGEGTLQDEAQKLADDARRLYPHIRMQLESDIRRQLEARNRAGRYRP